jgi:dimethylaniline monooxygenase (N-oxide forming)
MVNFFLDSVLALMEGSFGAAFVPYYRLCGPFTDPSAPMIANSELWEAVTRRGLFGNIIFGVIPMITYGILNSFAWTLSTITNYIK